MKNSGTRSLIYSHCSALEREIYLPLCYTMSHSSIATPINILEKFSLLKMPLYRALDSKHSSEPNTTKKNSISKFVNNSRIFYIGDGNSWNANCALTASRASFHFSSLAAAILFHVRFSVCSVRFRCKLHRRFFQPIEGDYNKQNKGFFLTGQSWRVLKSGYTAGSPEQQFRCCFADS